jgi:L,D-transpeptidase YcbB
VNSKLSWIVNRNFSLRLLPLCLFAVAFLNSCDNTISPNQHIMVENRDEMDGTVTQSIKQILSFALDNNGKLDDSLKLYLPEAVAKFYDAIDNVNAWSTDARWKANADSVYSIIERAELYGLFPKDYHLDQLKSLRKKLKDSIQQKDAVLWSKADLLLTDGAMKFLKHLKEGRLLPDSLSLSSDSSKTDAFFVRYATELLNGSVTAVTYSLEPKHKGYHQLKSALPKFLDSMDRKKYTYVVYPNKDSLALVKNVQKRLVESGYLSSSTKLPDSITFSNALKKYQKAKKLAADGKLGAATVRSLNTSDLERFFRIAITLDRYKQLPEQLPAKFIWVNLPGYYLQVWDSDTIVLESRVIVGKPHTRTPTLNSEISDMITYPQWTIPASIIKKEILPGLKRSPGYLARRGYSLINNKGQVINPHSINWAKYTKGIPFSVRQGSGDDNALGVMKFNFENPYSVYLHDTNQRYLFKNKERALSHGCVRVQEWEKLAFYIARNDSLNIKPGDTLKYTTQTIQDLLAKKERKRIVVENRIPLFIRYFTCEGKGGKVIFFDDIYGEDKKLREKYF